MKPSNLSFNAGLILTAVVLAFVVLATVLVERRRVNTGRPQIALQPVTPTAPASEPNGIPYSTQPAPVYSGPVATPAQVRPASGDLLDQATASAPAPSQLEVDLPVARSQQPVNGGWDEAPVARPTPYAYDPTRLNPRDLSRQLEGRTSLTPIPAVDPTFAPEPAYDSGAPAIATPPGLGPTPTPRPGSSVPMSRPRAIRTPGIPVQTNSSDQDPTIPQDPSTFLTPIPTNRPAMSNRLPVESNVTDGTGASPGMPQPGASATPGRAPGQTNWLGTSPIDPGRPGGFTIQSGRMTGGLNTPIPTPTRSVLNPRSSIEAPSPTPNAALASLPRATPMSSMVLPSSSPILPGMADTEDTQQAPKASPSPLVSPSASGMQKSSADGIRSPTSDTPATPQATPKVPTMVVAKVGTRSLSQAEADRRADVLLKLQGKPLNSDERPTVLRSAIEEWSEKTALAEEAKARQVSVTPAEITDTEERLKARIGKSPREILKSSGFSEAEIEREMADAAMADKFVRTVYTKKFDDKNLKALYEKAPESFEPSRRLRIREIFVPKGSDSEANARSLTQAKSIQAKAASGGDFEALAAQNSRSPSSRNGGDMGWFDESNPPTEAMAKALADKKPGQVSEVVEDTDGYRVYQIAEMKEPNKSFEASKAKVESMARAIARDEALQIAARKQKVDIVHLKLAQTKDAGVKVAAAPMAVRTRPEATPPAAASPRRSAPATAQQTPQPIRPMLVDARNGSAPSPDVVAETPSLLSRMTGPTNPQPLVTAASPATNPLGGATSWQPVVPPTPRTESSAGSANLPSGFGGPTRNLGAPKKSTGSSIPSVIQKPVAGVKGALSRAWGRLKPGADAAATPVPLAPAP